MTSSDDFEKAFASSEPPDGDGKPSALRVLPFVVLGILVLVLVMFVTTGQAGVVEVQDDQVVVIVNYLTGESSVDSQPGYKFFLPFLQQAFLLEKSTQKFLMSGDSDRDANHVAKLTVRANDGSNFWFDEVDIQYEIKPDMASLILSDSGVGQSFKRDWVRAYARSILRDEFGRFSASQVADPTNYRDATEAATSRLNELLEAHGIRIIQIVTPKPKFDQRYEQAIEDRKVADEEVNRIKAQAEQLRQERERRVAEVDAQKAVEFEELKGTLEQARIAAEQERVRVERDADAYKTRLVGEGQARRAQLIEQARGETERARKEAEGLQKQAEALAKQGEVLVREVLAQRLREIEFSLVPYTRDAAPERVELEGDLIGGGR